PGGADRRRLDRPRPRRDPGRRGHRRDGLDAEADGSRARPRAPRCARAGERGRRPPHHAGRERRRGRARRAASRRAWLGKNLGVAYEFKLPDLGEGLTEGEIARWLVAEGQEIAEDDPLVEVQTDKTTVEIPSPAGGTVARIMVAEGDVVPVGTVLVVIGEDGELPAAEQPAAEPAASVRATTQGQSPGPGQPGRV